MSLTSARRKAGTARKLEALASPIRHEVISLLGEGPSTVKALANRLGRSRQSLHYHVAQLLSAGVLRELGVQGAGRTQEQVYGLVDRQVAVGAGRSSHELNAVERATMALLRLTGRELKAAIRSAARTRGRAEEVVALRSRCRLDAAAREQLKGLIDRIGSTLKGAAQETEAPTYSVTIVVTPVRDALRGRRPRRSGA
jgi:DNA-binding transcriptional ArsR family regulator